MKRLVSALKCLIKNAKLERAKQRLEKQKQGLELRKGERK